MSVTGGTGAIDEIRHTVEQRIAALTPIDDASGGRLAEAMRHSLLAPAKRVRAILTVLSAEHCGAAPGAALDAAVSLEMIHAASLVFDDLPAMDDARLRRGRPTCHLEFGEDIAILAAVSLMNLGFQVVALDERLPPEMRVRIAAVLSQAIGTGGLTGGQARDLASRAVSELERAGRHDDGRHDRHVDEIEKTHALKTSALFVASAHAGAIVADAGAASEHAMVEFGHSLGLAFQAYDDLLDAHATVDAIGKDVARDLGKATVVDVLGRDGATARANAHVAHARAALVAADASGRRTHGPSRLDAYVGGLLKQLTAPLSVAR